MVDKDLFLHDLAIVAILKNEAPYLKEWLDYHLMAGVDHFYLYDNDSSDNQREVAAPYVKAGLVDYIPAPGKAMQYAVYNDAVKRFKFQSRYMAFIDGDEFIFPKSAVGGGYGIVDVVDEILSHDKNAAGLAINWQCFGSNVQDKADLSRGVLERFTRRAPKNWMLSPTKDNPNYHGNLHLKLIFNPRAVDYVNSPHYLNYFDGLYSLSETGEHLPNNQIHPSVNPKIPSDKIVVNHYSVKSREEFKAKTLRGDVDKIRNGKYSDSLFDTYDRNEEFDDGILKYRDERAKNFKPPDKSRAAERLLNALMKNLSPTLLPSTPQNFYAGKMETFLTCRAVAAYLQTKLTDSTPAKFFEEAALKATLRSIHGMNLADAKIFLRELPNLLTLPYPVVKDVRNAARELIRQMINFLINVIGTSKQLQLYKDYVELDYLQDLLKFKEE